MSHAEIPAISIEAGIRGCLRNLEVYGSNHLPKGLQVFSTKAHPTGFT
jgi:hypothetical protein